MGASIMMETSSAKEQAIPAVYKESSLETIEIYMELGRRYKEILNDKDKWVPNEQGASPDQVQLVNIDYPTHIAPCRTFNQGYEMSRFCSFEMIKSTRLCRNYRVSHKIELSPNQHCSLDTTYWGSFAYNTACPSDQISATATFHIFEETYDGVKCKQLDRNKNNVVEDTIDSLDKCAM